MLRRYSALIGWALAAAGFVAGLAALALPWAWYRVAANVTITGTGLHRTLGAAVYQLDGGSWALLALLCAVGLVAVAATTSGRTRRAVGATAAVLAPLAALLPLRMAGRVGASANSIVAQGFVSMTADASPAAGLWYGMAALVLLCFGAALIGLSTPPTAPRQDQAGWRRDRGRHREQQL